MVFLKAFSSPDRESVAVSYGSVKVPAAEGHRTLADPDLHSQCLLSLSLEPTLDVSPLQSFPHLPGHRSSDRSPTRTSTCGSSVILAFLILYIQIILHKI